MTMANMQQSVPTGIHSSDALMKRPTRLESDSIGSKEIPADACYGVQSLRAAENFPITGEKMHPELIRSLAKLKKACAIANCEAGSLDAKKAAAIEQACDQIIAGQYQDQFIVDPIQGGAGTSMNMNINEVAANAAIKLLGGKPGEYTLIHPNDDVNRGQSTNDVIPTAGKMTALVLLQQLEASLEHLQQALAKKADEFAPIIKMGRTQLQDAVPVRLGQEFSAYASAVSRGLARIRKSEQELKVINMGGTAIGTGINASQKYFDCITGELSQITGIQFQQAADLIDATQNADSFAAVSSAVKNCAVTLSKIANDLRLMSSGPRTGLEEINLPAKQNGSSIMPGKVNPVIPEVVTQAAYRVFGNDVTIEMACEAGQLELNAFEPVIFYSLFQSIDILTHAVDTLTVNCIEGITANPERCRHLLEESVGIVTALNPYIGYTRSASLAKEALKKHLPIRKLILEKHLMDQKELDAILDPYRLTRPGLPVRKDS